MKINLPFKTGQGKNFLLGIFILLTIVFFTIAMKFRHELADEKLKKVTYDSSFELKMIASRDSTIQRLLEVNTSYKDSLMESQKTGILIKEHYEKLHLTIRDANTNRKLDSLFSAFGVE